MTQYDKTNTEETTNENSQSVKKLRLAIKTILCSALSSYFVIVLVGLILELIERAKTPFSGICKYPPDMVVKCSYAHHLKDLILPSDPFALFGMLMFGVPLFFIFVAIFHRIFFGKNENNAFQRGCFTGCAVVIAAFLGMQILMTIRVSREVKKFEEMQRANRSTTTNHSNVIYKN